MGLTVTWLLLVIFLAIMTIANIISVIIKKRAFKEGIIYALAHFVILALVLLYPSLYVGFVGLTTGLYALLNSVVYFVDYHLARKDHIKGIFSKFVTSVLYFLAALVLFIVPNKSSAIIFIVSGIYLIIAAIIHLLESILDIVDRRFNVSLSLPIIFGALLPPRVYLKQIKTIDQDERVIRDVKDNPQAPLEIFIYLRDGLFESLGHVDIAYDGVVYSYGLHDPKARKIFGSAGDGVLIRVDRDPFMENCLKSGKTIVLDFKLEPDEKEMAIIKGRIDELMKDTIPFACDAKIEEELGEPMDAQDYISDVYRDTHCELYKFKKGRFKTYFVFTTNCVLLADHLVRNKEIDLLNMSGIITPGNYLNFLYSLYLKEDSIVKDLVVMKKKD